MGLWDKLRTVLDLAARVVQLEADAQQLRDEWGDVLDKVHRQWERDRKRKQREITQAEPGLDRPADFFTATDDKAQLRKRLRHLKMGNGEP